MQSTMTADCGALLRRRIAAPILALVVMACGENSESPSSSIPSSVDDAEAVTKIEVEQTSPEGLQVEFENPEMPEGWSPESTMECVPPSGSTFYPGTSVVTCTAVEADGRTEKRQFEIRVEDTLAPSIFQSDLTIAAKTENDVPVFYSPKVQDAGDPSPTLSCVPASGSRFPVGRSSVRCTATDKSGNQAAHQFAVTVKPFAAFCGNERVDLPGEQCDLGKANGAHGSCCTKNCRFESVDECSGGGSEQCGIDKCFDCRCDVPVNCKDPITTPEREGPGGLTCRDGLDNDCDGFFDLDDLDCAPALLSVQCSLAASDEGQGQACVGNHQIEYEIHGASPDATITAELLALGTDGQLIGALPVSRGDRVILTNRTDQAPELRSNGSQHFVRAPATQLQITVEDGGHVVRSFCSNAPGLDFATPSKTSFSIADGGATPVLVALPRVDPTSLVVEVDGIDLLAELGIDAGIDFPGGPYEGELRIGDSILSVLDLVVSAESGALLGSNTLTMVLQGLPAGGHILTVRGQAEPGTVDRNPVEFCYVDDLWAAQRIAVLGIEIESPLPGSTAPAGSTLVRATIRHGLPIENVFINGFSQDVSPQTMTPGEAGVSADQYVLEIDRLVEPTDLQAEFEGRPSDVLGFDLGSNRLILRAIDALGLQAVERSTFASGEVVPIVHPGEADASFEDEVENALTVGIDGVTFSEALQLFCAELRPLVQDFLQEQAETAQDDFLLARGLPLELNGLGVCEPLVEATLDNKEVQNGVETRFDPDIRIDALGCFADFSNGQLNLTINPQARLGYSARGECGLCLPTGGGLGEVSVAVDFDIAVRFAQIRTTLRDWENRQPINPNNPSYLRFLEDSLSTQAIGQFEIIESSLKSVASGAFSSEISQAVLDLVETDGRFRRNLEARLNPDDLIASEIQRFLGNWLSEFARPKIDAALEHKFCSGSISPGDSCERDGDCPRGRGDDGVVIPAGECLAEILVCDSGDRLGEECPDRNCGRGNQCVPAARVCNSGSGEGNSCEFDSGCAGDALCVNVMACLGGVEDGFSCIDDIDCVGGGRCIAQTDTTLVDRVQDQFGLDSFMTDFRGIAITLNGKFGPSLLDPEIESTPGGLRTEAEAPAVDAGGVGRSYVAISDDTINQVIASLTAFGEYKSDGCFSVPPDSGAPATVGDFIPDCGSGPTDVGTGACVGITGGDCEGLSSPGDQGACHAAQGDACNTILLSTSIFERAAELESCRNAPIRNITSEMPLLYCLRADIPPSFWIRDDFDADGSPIQTENTIETYFRVNDLFVGIVVDREESGGGSLAALQECAQSTSDPETNCLLTASCLDLNFPTNFSLDTTDQDYSVVVELIGVRRIDRSDTAVCAGGVTRNGNDPLGLSARFEAVTDSLLETANRSWPPLGKVLALPAEFLTTDLEDPQLIAIRTSEAQPGFDDYIAVVTSLSGDLCGNRICDAGQEGTEVCGLSGPGRCVEDCGLCGLREACSSNSDCKSDSCVDGECRVDNLSAESLSCSGNCLFGVDCLSGICNFGICSNARPALTPCTDDRACLSGSCENLVCAQICGDNYCDGTERCGSSNSSGLECNADCGLCSLGQICSADNDCTSDLCNLATCETPRSNGSVCSRDKLCLSDNCRLGICRPADCRPVTASCSVNNDCCLGSCRDDLIGGGRSCRAI